MAGSSCKVAELERSGRTSDGFPVPGTNHPNSLGPCSNAFTCPYSCSSGFWSSLPVVRSLHSGNPCHLLKVPGGYFSRLPTLLQLLGTVAHFPNFPSYHHLLQAWPRTFSSHSLVAGSSCSSPEVVYLSTLSCIASRLSHSPLTPALIPPSSCPSCLHLFTIVMFFII